MCNTWRNVFFQSMKNNTLKFEEINEEFDSQNPTTIVRGVWNHHSYTVGHATTKSWKSSIWVFPQFWNSSVFQILQLFKIFTISFFFFIGYIYIYEFMSSTTFTYCYFFKLFFLLSECDRTLPPLCYTQPNLFTNSSCAFYLKLVQNLHCVLVSWRICEWNF